MSPFRDFEAASRSVLQFLHNRLGFGLWMVTRTEGDDWIVLASEDHGYGVEPGQVFRWTDSFCSRMVRGEGPRVAPRADAVPAYAEAPIGRQVKIGSYVGVPLQREDGSLFGTLCAIDPSPQSDRVREEQPLVELLAGLLSALLQTELRAAEQARRAEKAEVESLRDSLTALYGRRGWDQLLAREEERCRRYGHPAAVVSIDLDDLKRVNDSQGHAAGDELITRAAKALAGAVRTTDVAARLGGDEFAVLLVECDPANAQAVVAKIRADLDAAGVRASLGMAPRHPGRGMAAAVEEADAAMYADKKARKG